jgi:GNAT superfamily N-acetyltransferase
VAIDARPIDSPPVLSRLRAWSHGAQAAVCDVIEPWAHGTVVRATRYPSYFAFNLVRVEEDPGMGVEELVELADLAQAGLRHRRIDFDAAALAEPLRADFEARGWEATRLLWMRHEGPPPPEPVATVEEVPYDAAEDLRLAWHREDSPGRDVQGTHLQAARELALMRGTQVLAIHERGVPVSFAQVERRGTAAEVTQVYVRADRRGHGLGTAVTSAAVLAGSGADDLWICADDEDRAKDLYARLGFQPVTTSMEFTLWP